MPIIETYYLIDFENVNEYDLFCSNNLGSHDHIHIFSTENAPKISIETLSSFNSTEHFSHIVPAGKQSLDMHLVSYLGYLIGKNDKKKCKYIIVSKDTDYDNVISFIKNLTPSDITRQVRIDSISKRNSAAIKTVSTNNTNAAMATPQNRSLLNTKIQRAIRDAGYAQSTINTVASIVVKHYGEDKFANNVHNELKKTYSDYSDIYKIVKPIINQCSSTCSKATTTSQHNNNNNNNNEIQKILNKANFNNNIISYVASLCSKHYNDKNGKQAIYSSIVAKYGQKQGLNIYNHIKKNL